MCITSMENLMALIREWYELKKLMNECSCDLCSDPYTQREAVTRYRRGGKIASGRDLCKKCTAVLAKKKLAETGRVNLSSMSPERRRELASKGGRIGSNTAGARSSRFSKTSWSTKTDEEKLFYAKRASAGLQAKLQDPEFAKRHWAKIFAQKKIGFLSKGHEDLHQSLSSLGFEMHTQIDRMEVDECHKDLKIVVEFNGDFWHCNPRIWKADQYNKAIRMTAGEKWSKDIARKKVLQGLGYSVLTVWENDWKRDKQKCLDAIIEHMKEKKK